VPNIAEKEHRVVREEEQSLASRAQWGQEANQAMTRGGLFVLPCKDIGSDVGRKIAFKIGQRMTFACGEGVLVGSPSRIPWPRWTGAVSVVGL